MGVSRRVVLVGLFLATTSSSFAVGFVRGKGTDDALKAASALHASEGASEASLVAAVKQQLTTEMGLVPVNVLRERRASFVQLYSHDRMGQTHYGTAGYLGHGYFITVKHAVVALGGESGQHKAPEIVGVDVVYQDQAVPAQVVDMGDANSEVDSGDWAIIRSRDLDLPTLHVDAHFPFEFAEPVFRLGNDYSKGIMLSSGYVGQRTTGGLITCLTDGHPGVSGGGVLNRRGDLVGIPIGRLEGDYRFSFILPLRPEMLRTIPTLAPRT